MISELKKKTLSEAQINTLIQNILTWHHYDFTYYSRDSLKRRINRLYKFEKVNSYEELSEKIRCDKDYINYFIGRITVNVTEMFRDPEFFEALRKAILPALAERKQIKIWHAGCSSGEEVYSTAILLEEAGLLDRSILYASDINEQVLEIARNGIFPLSLMQLYAKNYLECGGQKDFSSYYDKVEGGLKLKEVLKKNMIFTNHNLASDSKFNHFDLIICRNVLIYFDNDLQEKVLTLFDSSLLPNSYLALGEKETIRSSAIYKRYKQNGSVRVWQKLS